MSEAALSKHLRVLAEAGIVAANRDGYYILYELVRGPLEKLSPKLLELLGIDERQPRNTPRPD